MEPKSPSAIWHMEEIYAIIRLWRHEHENNGKYIVL